MCWNKEVSLNTFIFSCFALGFIYYNNTYTQYKLSEFKNQWVYVALFSFSSMQLIEYFLWLSIENNNKKMNTIWSIIAFIILCIQPIFYLMILPSSVAYYRNIFIVFYTIIILFLFIYRQLTSPLVFTTAVGENKHLSWSWVWYKMHNNKPEISIFSRIFYTLYIVIILGVCIYMLPYYYAAIISIIFYLIFLKNISSAIGSLWCWIANTIFIVLLFKLLFLLPMCK
jgi:hypothetical protein